MNKNFLNIIVNLLFLAIMLIGVFYFFFVRFVKNIPIPLPSSDITVISVKAKFFTDYTAGNQWLSKLPINIINNLKMIDTNFSISENEFKRSSLFLDDFNQNFPEFLNQKSQQSNTDNNLLTSSATSIPATGLANITTSISTQTSLTAATTTTTIFILENTATENERSVPTKTENIKKR